MQWTCLQPFVHYSWSRSPHLILTFSVQKRKFFVWETQIVVQGTTANLIAEMAYSVQKHATKWTVVIARILVMLCTNILLNWPDSTCWTTLELFTRQNGLEGISNFHYRMARKKSCIFIPIEKLYVHLVLVSLCFTAIYVKFWTIEQDAPHHHLLSSRAWENLFSFIFDDLTNLSKHDVFDCI